VGSTSEFASRLQEMSAKEMKELKLSEAKAKKAATIAENKAKRDDQAAAATKAAAAKVKIAEKAKLVRPHPGPLCVSEMELSCDSWWYPKTRPCSWAC
jgi:hypothetical protein